MAETAEDFVMKLFTPIVAIASVVFFIQKIIEWIWRAIVPHAIPILWGAGILFALGIACFVLLMRAGSNRAAWKALVFSLWCFAVFGAVVYGGNNEKLPWARQILESASWTIDHPIITGIVVIIILILAVMLPLPILGRSRCFANSEFMRGFEEGQRDCSENE